MSYNITFEELDDLIYSSSKINDDFTCIFSKKDNENIEVSKLIMKIENVNEERYNAIKFDLLIDMENPENKQFYEYLDKLEKQIINLAIDKNNNNEISDSIRDLWGDELNEDDIKDKFKSGLKNNGGKKLFELKLNEKELYLKDLLVENNCAEFSIKCTCIWINKNSFGLSWRINEIIKKA